jgi:hypothetical protein
MITSTTPKLDAAVDRLIPRLQSLCTDLIENAKTSSSIESNLRATFLLARLRKTIKELEISQCKTSS